MDKLSVGYHKYIGVTISSTVSGVLRQADLTEWLMIIILGADENIAESRSESNKLCPYRVLDVYTLVYLHNVRCTYT